MPKNKLEDLRNHLFMTLEKLQDDENPMELDRAETIADVAQVLVNTYKAETDFHSKVGYLAGSFVDTPDAARQLPPERKLKLL
jgi:hypothetical protein